MPGKFFLYKYQIGDIVKMKKQHPCGSDLWEVLGLGSKLRLRCKGCGHIQDMKREAVEKATLSVSSAS